MAAPAYRVRVRNAKHPRITVGCVLRNPQDLDAFWILAASNPPNTILLEPIAR